MLLAGHDRTGLRCTDDGTEPSHTARAQACACFIEHDLLAALDALGKQRFDIRKRKRRGKNDAALRGRPGKLGHRKEWLARERRCQVKPRATTIGEQKRSVGTSVPGDTVGMSECEQGAD